MWSNDYIKVPFKDKGRDKQGADCWGLARIIYYEQLNIELPSLLDYDNTKDKTSICELYKTERSDWVKVPFGEEKEFDIVVIKMLGTPTHVGVVIKKDFMIHCEKGAGTNIVNYRKEAQWFRRIEGFFRHAKHDSSNVAPTV